MRSEQIFTNLSCNQNCVYCTIRRPRDDRAWILGGAVRARIDAALAEGAQELVLTGGEPTMRNDLPSLVAYARGRGAKQVVLETNASLLDLPRARELKAAGVTLARVNLSGWGKRLDAVTRDPGGFERSLVGIRALRDAEILVDVSAALVRSTLRLVPKLPERLVAEFGERPVRTLMLRVPVDGPDPGELVSYEEAAETILAVEAAGRAAGVHVKMSPDSGPPPCVFAQPSKAAHLYAMTPGARRRPDHVQTEACERCQMADRCSGLPRSYLTRRPAPQMKPITEDRVRRRLSIISTVEEQVAREFVGINRMHFEGYGDVEEHLIRVQFLCNQACRFCFVSTHLPGAGDEAVRRAIVEAGQKGVRITLTGGEPTLNPNLVEYVRLAKSVSRLPVNLQTNAIRLADPSLAKALAEAGLAEAFISLHGTTAEISDAITEAPGTFHKTLAGIDNVYALGIFVILNFVICERNLHDLVPYVRMIGEHWPKAFVNISFVAPSADVVPKEKALVPRYSDVLPQLAEAVAEAQRLGLLIGGFESMCGIPLCLVPTSLARYFAMSDIPEGFDGGEFVKTAACQECSLKNKCYGLRRGYLDLHGDDELRAVKADEVLADVSGLRAISVGGELRTVDGFDIAAKWAAGLSAK